MDGECGDADTGLPGSALPHLPAVMAVGAFAVDTWLIDAPFSAKAIVKLALYTYSAARQPRRIEL